MFLFCRNAEFLRGIGFPPPHGMTLAFELGAPSIPHRLVVVYSDDDAFEVVQIALRLFGTRLEGPSERFLRRSLDPKAWSTGKSIVREMADKAGLNKDQVLETIWKKE